jgi:Uncharacterized conserved protein (DUF2290)
VSKKSLTPEQVRRDVADLLDYLLESDLAYTVNPVGMVGPAGRKLITWQGQTRGEPLFTHGQHPTLTDYLRWVEDGAYSALLADGSLLQITYSVSAGDVVGHRLAYVPSPVMVDEDMFDSGDLVDYLTGMPFAASDLSLRSPIRFDYDPPAAGEAHPASHLTVSVVDCRVPCRTWLPLSAFVRFVYQHFYPAQWRLHDALRKPIARGPSSTAKMPDQFLDEPHVSWR